MSNLADEGTRMDHLFRGLSPALYEQLYVMGITKCEEFLEIAKLHADAVKTAYERDYEDARKEDEKTLIGSIGIEGIQDLKIQNSAVERRTS